MSEYIHGYDQNESMRLYEQAHLLADGVFKDIAFKAGSKILEVGCGVGAQTALLIEKFPEIEIFAFDKEPNQIKAAKANFAAHPNLKLKLDRVHFQVGDGTKLDVANEQFDGAFLCWTLEHVTVPIQILSEIKRLLKKHSPIFINEVFNSLFNFTPYDKNIAHYWNLFNQLQISLNGNPYVGLELGSILDKLEFHEIKTDINHYLMDRRDLKKRDAMLNYWEKLLLSAAPELLNRELINSSDLSALNLSFQKLIENPDSVFMFGWIKAKAIKI
jgi:ubiquinone/menaquinone biosynthesis C-methylase UbiE